MKKETAFAVCLILGLARAPGAFAQDWKLPVFTVKYELTEGTIEDPDPDEDILIPASLRNTVTFQVREAAAPFGFGLAARYSAKDYLLQSGDYAYVSLDQDSTLKAADFLKLGLAFGGKWAHSPLPDASGLSKDYLALKTKADAEIEVFDGTALDFGISAEYDLYEAAEKARHLYTAGAGVTSRLGEWEVSGRYRGVFRLPLGAASTAQATMLNEGSFTFHWDPNR
jgi:hypothetical protein